MASVARCLRELTADGFAPRDLAIFCRSEIRLREHAEAALQQCDLVGHYLSDDAPPTDAQVSLGSMAPRQGPGIQGRHRDGLRRKHVAARQRARGHGGRSRPCGVRRA